MQFGAKVRKKWDICKYFYLKVNFLLQFLAYMQKFYYFCTVEYFGLISSKLNIAVKQVAATVALLNENATIPFIARYRKEKTGSLDEVQIAAISGGVSSLSGDR